MDKKELQKRAGILKEDYSLRASGVTAFCMDPDMGMWETDGIPPAPSDAEQAQSRSGHVDMKISEREQLPSVKTHSPEQIAKKHGVQIEQIMQQLSKGMEIEQEHTMDKDKAKEIALDHLLEFPDYYDRLDKVEEEITDICRLAGIGEDADITECPGPDGLLDSGMKKIRSVMGALKQGRVSNQQMFLRLKAALDDLQSAADESKNVHSGEQM